MKSARAIVLCGTLAMVGLAVVLSQRSPAQQATGAGDDQEGVVADQGSQGQQGGIEQTGSGASTSDLQVGRGSAGARTVGIGEQAPATAGTVGFQDFQNQPSVRGHRGFQGTVQRGYNSAYYGMMPRAPDPLQREDAQLEQQSHNLANQYATAENDEARQKLRGELAEVIAKHFDVRQGIRESEVRDIEARVKHLRDALERRQAAREEIIQRRLAQLLSDAQGVGF